MLELGLCANANWLTVVHHRDTENTEILERFQRKSVKEMLLEWFDIQTTEVLKKTVEEKFSDFSGPLR